MGYTGKHFLLGAFPLLQCLGHPSLFSRGAEHLSSNANLGHAGGHLDAWHHGERDGSGKPKAYPTPLSSLLSMCKLYGSSWYKRRAHSRGAGKFPEEQGYFFGRGRFSNWKWLNLDNNSRGCLLCGAFCTPKIHQGHAL